MATGSAIQAGDTTRDASQVDYIENHPLEVFLFNSTGWITWVWLVIRILLGLQWLQAGWGKLDQPQMDGWHVNSRLLAERNKLLRPTPLPGGLRLVRELPSMAGRQRSGQVDGPAGGLRRVPRRYRPHTGLSHRRRCFLARPLELQLHACRERRRQSRLFCGRAASHTGLEKRRLVGPGPLDAARCSVHPGTRAIC